MHEDVIIVLAEDDMGHALLIEKNLRRVGIENKIIHIKDGQKTVDFFLKNGEGEHRKSGQAYLLLLDIRMPSLDGIEVLRTLKNDSELRKVPVIMITSTDDPREIQKCHRLGCNFYITKPIDYDQFVLAIKHLGVFLSVSEVPVLNGETE